MARDFPRSRRLEEQIQRVVSELIRVHVRDPRVRGAVITNVRVSGDLGVAWVYYSVLSGDVPAADLQAGLDRAAGFMRTQLAQELTTRNVPELRFRFDEAAERGRDLERVIDEAVSRDRAGAADGSEPEEAE